MAKMSSKRMLRWGLVALAVIAIAVLGYRFWKSRQAALPEGIASGNGRIEAKLVDVSANEPLRVKEIRADEGALVKPGQVLVQMDTETLEAELQKAKASIASAQEKVAGAEASVTTANTRISLARVELDRSQKLVKQGAGAQRELDVRETTVQTELASLTEAEAALRTAKQEVEVARAGAEVIETRIRDATLRAPVTGRVLYRLAEPGEVLAAGGKALTLVDLSDVYMEIFLPSEKAASLQPGAEARIVLDHQPDLAIPGTVSFVSPEAQFTPKQVETATEREKLMFRVKIQIPHELASQYVERLRTGIRGVGYVKLDPSTAWPPRLQNLVASPPQAHP